MASRLVEILVRVKDEASAAFDKLVGSIESAGRSVVSLKGLIIGAVTGAVVTGIEKLIELFAEEEQTVVRLNAALRVSGQYTEAGSAAIQKMAEDMQATTTHSREEALGVSAQFASLARELTTKQIAEAQQIAIGLADATGKSVENASLMIVRSLTGQGNALKRYGVDLDTSGTQQEKFNAIAAKLGPLFTISKEEANTLAGHIAQTKNEFVDLERTIGEVIVRIFGINESGSTLRDTFKKWREEIVAHGGAIVQWGRAFVESIKLVGDVFVALAETVIGVFVAINDGGGVLVEAIKGAVKVAFDAVVNFLVDVLNGIFDKIGEVAAHFHMSFKVHLDRLNSDGAWDGMRANVSALKADVSAIGQAWSDVGDRFKNVQGIMGSSASQPLPGVGTAGGGKNIGVSGGEDPSESLRRQLEEQKLLDAEYKSGVISVDAYHAGLQRVHDQLTMLRGNEGLTRAELVQLYDALAKIKDVRITEVLAEQSKLEGLFKTGRIGVAEYDAGIKALVERMKELLRAAGLTEEQIAKITNAMNKAGDSMKGLGPQLKHAFGLGPGEGAAALEDANKTVAKMTKGLGDDFANAVGQALTAGGNFGKTVEKAVGQAAAANAKLAVGRGLMELAEGIAASFLNPPEAAKHFAAAAQFAEAAAFMSAIAGATGGFSGGGGGSGGGAATAAQNVAGQAGGIVINIPAEFPNSQAFIDKLMSNIEQAGDRRVTVKAQG